MRKVPPLLPNHAGAVLRRIDSLRRRFPAQVHWFEARFSPEGILGLHLTLGALALLAMAWIFGSIAEDVVTRDPIVVLDQQVANWFRQHGTATFFRAMSVVTFFGSGLWIFCVAAFGSAFLIWRAGMVSPADPLPRRSGRWAAQSVAENGVPPRTPALGPSARRPS